MLLSLYQLMAFSRVFTRLGVPLTIDPLERLRCYEASASLDAEIETAFPQTKKGETSSSHSVSDRKLLCSLCSEATL